MKRFILAICVLVFSGYVYAQPSNGLVAHWLLDAASGTTVADNSGNGNTGTLNGGAWRPSGGTVNGALFFNGSTDYVAFNNAIGASAALSVSLWINASSLKHQIPVDKLPSSGVAGWSVKMRNNGDIWIRVGSEANNTDLVVPGAYMVNTWVNLIFTYEAGILTAYRNGTVAGVRKNIIQTVNNTNTQLRLGRAVNNGGEAFGGLLDDIRVYNRALSLDEVMTMNGKTLPKRDVDDFTLWYDSDAGDVFTDALPIGNGRLGAMVYGGVARDVIGLNECTVWSGNPGNNNKNGAAGLLAQARSQIFAGNYTAADATVAQMIGSGQERFQPVGNLYLNFPGHVAANYTRELDLKTAIVKTTYTHAGVTYNREYFASYPDQVIVVRITASQPGKISFTTSMDSPQTPVSTASSGNDLLILNGQADAVRFQNRLKVKTEGGSVSAGNNNISVSGANSATLTLAIGSNFNSYNNVTGDQAARATEYINKINNKSYEHILGDHLIDYQNLFKRVDIRVGTANSFSKYPTNVRGALFGLSDDPGLVNLHYQFGRYLLIACSRSGSQPANLQGVWNKDIYPAWGSKYTTNINFQMNYWMAETANLPECAIPLIDKTKALVGPGQQTAQIHWGGKLWMGASSQHGSVEQNRSD